MIESLLESVFEKTNRQKVKYTVHFSNRTKFKEVVGDALNTQSHIMFVF